MKTNEVLAKLDTSEVTDMTKILQHAYVLTTDINLDIKSVTSLQQAFENCKAVESITLTGGGVDNPSALTYMQIE